MKDDPRPLHCRYCIFPWRRLNVDVDKFGIHVCITESQKCIAAPPGMAAITLSDDAWAAADKTPTLST